MSCPCPAGQTDTEQLILTKSGHWTDTRQNFREIRTKTGQGQDRDSAVRQTLARLKCRNRLNYCYHRTLLCMHVNISEWTRKMDILRLIEMPFADPFRGCQHDIV